jgi:hypothetical protein
MSRISFHSELKKPFATLSPTLGIALTARSEVILVPIGCDRQRETSEEGAIVKNVQLILGRSSVFGPG